ncbi:MAG: DUF4375 domain-containing protein [Bryobacteraceae bacterium]
MSNVDSLERAASGVVEQCLRDGLESLSGRDRVLFLLWCHAPQIDNGGHGAFFYNSPADYYEETVEALESLDLKPYADLLRRAAEILFSGDVPREMEERNEQIGALPDSVDDELAAIDDQYESLGGGDRVLESLGRWYFRNRH